MVKIKTQRLKAKSIGQLNIGQAIKVEDFWNAGNISFLFSSYFIFVSLEIFILIIQNLG